MSKFQVGDTWLTRSKETELVIVSTNAPGDRPIVAAGVRSDGTTFINVYPPSGHSYKDGREHATDLVAKVEPLFEATVQVNEHGAIYAEKVDVTYMIGSAWRRIRVREVR